MLRTSRTSRLRTLFHSISALFLTPLLCCSKDTRNTIEFLQMATASKRTHSDLGTDSAAPLKRRSFILNNFTSHRGNVPVTQLMKGTEYYSSDSEDDTLNENANQFSNNLIGITAAGVLDPKLVEAVARYTDSESSAGSDDEKNHFITSVHYQVSEGNTRRKSLSRPGSFSSYFKKAQVSKMDLSARGRCFDYIVQSIDEVWARYCDTTSSAEAIVYGNLARKKAQKSGCNIKTQRYHHSHKALKISDNETDSDVNADDNNEDDDESSGYKSEATNPTEYETDYGESRTVSNLPDSVKLQSLKSRLTKAKYDLEQVYDSKENDDSCSFWRRWDMIKYSAVEMMEEDDDDEIIENVIEELEQGRCYMN